MFLPKGYGHSRYITRKGPLDPYHPYGILLPVNLQQIQKDLTQGAQKAQNILTYASQSLPDDISQTVEEVRRTNVLAQQNLEKSQKTQSYLMVALVATTAVLVLVGATLIHKARK